MAVIENNQMAADNGWIVGDRKPLSTAHGHVGSSVGIIMELPPDAGNGLYDPQQLLPCPTTEMLIHVYWSCLHNS